MNSTQKPEIIFIDFDGVISKNSILTNLNNIHQFINRYTPLPFETLLCLFKWTTCFSIQDTINYLFSSLGIENKIYEFYQKISQVDSYNNIPIKIEDSFYQFLNFCDNNTIRYLLFSAAVNINQTQLANRIGNHNIYNLNDRSKANYYTYLETAKELDIDLKKTMYIDDHPLALLTGKLHGMTTVMMINDVFTIKDYNIYRSYIDHKINSFTELETIITKAIQKEYLLWCKDFVSDL